MATLQDIARLAGVSGATVSNVLRSRGSASAATSARVHDAARRLGYRPNLFARALAEGRAPTIAVFFPNIANPFYSQFALEAEHAARRRDHFLLVCHAATPEGTLDTAYLRAVAGRLSEGLIILGSDVGRENLLAALPDGVPTVLSTWEDPNAYPTKPCVTIDFEQAGRLASEHLIGLGHRHIAILAGGDVHRVIHTARFDGAVAALRTAGLAPGSDAVATAEDSIAGGYQGARRLLDAGPDITAILATNDLLAIGALQAASERHILVPNRLSVVGITGIAMTAEMRPALTTIDISTRSLAEGSVNLLLDLITDPNSVSPDALRVVGQPRLIRRESTAPPAT